MYTFAQAFCQKPVQECLAGGFRAFSSMQAAATAQPPALLTLSAREECWLDGSNPMHPVTIPALLTVLGTDWWW